MVKSLPNVTEVEQSLLGSLMIYPKTADRVFQSGLSVDSFYIDSHRKIFSAIKYIYEKGIEVDFHSVKTYLLDSNQLSLVGGEDYLISLTETAVSSYNIDTFIDLIQNKAYMRNMIEVCQKIVEDGLNGQFDVDEFLDSSEKAVLNVSRSRRASEFKTSLEVVENVIKNIRAMAENKSGITGLKTGLEDLDRVTHGFQRGDLIILAARPSMGKTAVALNLASRIASYQKNEAVAIFSLEMPAEHLIERILASKSKVPGGNIKTGRMTDSEWGRLNEAAAEVTESKIFIDDTSGIKMHEIFSKCRKLKVEHGLAAIMVDYIQLISGPNNSKENRQQEVSDISRNLKALARELEVPVIALSQLSRSVESRTDKRPILSDLRESGALEQDADIVMLLYRDEYYKKNEEEVQEKNMDPDATQVLELDIAKHRNGATRVVNFAFQPSYSAIFSIQNDDR